MFKEIVVGNAIADGSQFRGWFVGDIEKWCGESKFEAEKYGLRNSKALEIRWSVFDKGEKRPGGWSKCAGKTCLGLLVKGDFVISFRETTDPSNTTAHRLHKEGDYLLWCEDIEHFWEAESPTVLVAVRWDV